MVSPPGTAAANGIAGRCATAERAVVPSVSSRSVVHLEQRLGALAALARVQQGTGLNRRSPMDTYASQGDR